MPSFVGRARVASLLVAIALLTFGCGGDDGPGDPVDGGRVDAGSRPELDSGAGSDAGAATDSGAVPPDGGGLVDAGADGGGPVSMPCVATGACDPFDVTSCGAQACRRGAMGAECMAVDAAPLPAGAVCERPEQCVAGTMCLNFGDGFHCERMCPEGSVGHCGDGFVCTGTIGDPCIQICRPLPAACDIYAQDCADPEDTCTLATDSERDIPYTGCRPAGPRAAGETCGGSDGTCGHDLICIRIAGVTSCRQPCDAAAATDECPTGQACTGRSSTWMVGYCVERT